MMDRQADFTDKKLRGRPMLLRQVSARRESAIAGAPPLLDQVDLTLNRGEWMYVAGTNGSGKSTLGRLLAGLGFPGELRAETWDRGFAGEAPAPYAMQQPDAQLFGTTPREEIVFAREWLGADGSAIAGLAYDALDEVGLRDAADLPWRALSGGERQLAAVAAAAAGHAPLLVLDEATSMLDAESQALVLRLARRRHREGAAVVWITQRIEELESGRRVVALSEGRIVYDGSVDVFLAGEKLDDGTHEEPPCLRCGLRLPYEAALKRELARRKGPSSAVRASRDARPSTPERVSLADSQPAPSPASSVALRFQGLPLRDAADGAAAATRPLELQPGRIVVLLGQNGAGKTRLLEIAAGLRVAAKTRASYVDGSVEEARRELARKAGLLAYSYACQSPEDQLFAASVEAELAYVLRPYGLTDAERSLRIRAALRSVGWDESWLARDPYAMSGGERRRTALACALAPPAPWLLLDEPTAGLDAIGCERLAASLVEERSRGRGILLVAHDLDWALPLADELLLLGPDGAIRRCERSALLAHPSWWEEAGLREPASYAAALEAWKNGLDEARAWDTAEIAAALSEEGGQRREADARHAGSPAGERISRPAARRRQSVPAAERLSAFDPRAVWLGYVSVSLAMFAASGWSGLAASAALTAAIVLAARLPLREYKGPLVAFALFTAASTALSGLTGDSGEAGAWWHGADSLVTFRSFAKTWCVLAVGIALPAAIPPLRLRRALTQILPRRGGAGRRSQRLVLTVTLLLRFVPQLMAEWDRFARIAVARGKDTGRSPAATLRKLRSTAVPFMLSLFRMGETVTLALESRGIGRRETPIDTERLRWRTRDNLLLLAVAFACAALALLDRFN
ncbi:ATP-binding cassette domain-containing protein [Cohnella sp. JJ-181]|uniref:ATP-binding cassette domain-containing protein n=1 Tax=Cohnella rhizoplanae TaxID=2974897 RepID=UPI0022FFA86A|nr:ATP-binding cassette domain-containing protein [Cohnella sp. JJ-181]CAI6029332.1 Vitamin B12 import ATP-binding protein BtuD [Cohnella sp. JJ-181]